MEWKRKNHQERKPAFKSRADGETHRIQLAASAADVNRNSSKYQETKKVMQRSSHFDQKRRSIKLEKFNDNKGKQRREKIIQKNSGIAVMPIMRGMVSINKCTSNKWIPKIRDELTHRNVPIDEAEGLQKLKEKLLVHESDGQQGKRRKNGLSLLPVGCLGLTRIN